MRVRNAINNSTYDYMLKISGKFCEDDFMAIDLFIRYHVSIHVLKPLYRTIHISQTTKAAESHI